MSIRFASPADAKATVVKVLKSSYPYARKMQILTVLEQRSKYSKSPKREQVAIARKGKERLRRTKKDV